LNLLGFEVKRSSPKLSVTGTEFHARSIVASAAPRPNRASTVPLAPSDPQPEAATQWRRIITSDPRESWWLALPSKLLPKQVDQIKRAGLGGDVWQVWQLDGLMQSSWPMYRKCLHELKQGVADSRWIVRAFAGEGEKPSKLAQEKAELVRRAIISFAPNPFNDEKGFSGLIYNMCDAVSIGMSMNELQWAQVGSELLPKAATWVHPRHYTFDSKGNIAILSDSELGTNLDLSKKVRPIGAQEMAGKFLCYQYMSKSGSSLSSGMVHPLGPWWSYWIYGREWIAVMAQKHGTPFLKGKYQPGALSPSEQTTIENRLRDAGANNYMLTPMSVDVEVVPAQALSKDNPIVTLMKQADEAPQYLLLGQTGTTTATPGKLGGEDAHKDVKRDRIQALAGQIGACLTEQFAKAVLVANYGPNGADECPVIEPDFTEVASPEKQAARWVQLLSTRVPVSKGEFYKENSLTEPSVGDEVIVDGKATIYEGAKTADEMFEEDLNKQVMQAEASMALQGEAQQAQQPQEAAKASARRPKDAIWASHERKLRDALVHATDAELDELEAKLTAAETAAHRNGEVRELDLAVEKITKRF